MFHLINFVANAFLLALATVTVPSVFFGLIAIAADRYRQGQQTEATAAPEPQQTFAIPEVTPVQAAAFAQVDPLAPETVTRKTAVPKKTAVQATAKPRTAPRSLAELLKAEDRKRA